MSERTTSSWSVFIVVAIVSTLGSRPVVHANVEANGSIAIPETSPLVDLTPALDDHATPTLSVDTVKNEQQANELREADAAMSHSVTPVERQPLGRASQSSQPNEAGHRLSKDSGEHLERFGPGVNEIAKVIGALSVVIGLILLVRAGMKRAGGLGSAAGRPSGVLEILARYPVGRHQHLVLLKVARRVVLAHQSGAAMTTLSEMTDPEEVASLLARMEAGANSRDAARFKKSLDAFMRQHDQPASAGGSPRAVVAYPEAEIVDLTRHQGSAFSRLFARKDSKR